MPSCPIPDTWPAVSPTAVPVTSPASRLSPSKMAPGPQVCSLEIQYNFPFGTSNRASFSSSSSSETPRSSTGSPRPSPSEAFTSPEEPCRLEEIKEEEDVDKDSLPAVPPVPVPAPQPPGNAIVKRPRGRPRKHPIPEATGESKSPKGRSKTGCITCRRRKKKCDETKPACMHCQKNNVVCEGYPPREYWKSGKQRATARHGTLEPPSLPLIINGVENNVDREFFSYFADYVSCKLSLWHDENNPFTKLLIPMAFEHEGLMHSLLYLSGTHFTLNQYATDECHVRTEHHWMKAVQSLRESVAQIIARDQSSSASNASVDTPVVASSLVMILQTIAAGDTSRRHLDHIKAVKYWLRNLQITTANEEVQNFLVEFLVYHDVANSITATNHLNVLMTDEFKLDCFQCTPDAATLLGVVDGLFVILSRVSSLRAQVRVNREQGRIPSVPYPLMAQALEIERQINEWSPNQEPHSPRYYTAMLYRQCTWIYLYRSIKESQPDEKIKDAVDGAIEYLQAVPRDSGTQSVLLLPVFLIACAAFEHEQRLPILDAFDELQSFSSLGNINRTREAVTKVWELMDQGSADSWDWEKIVDGNFLVT
ncbi:fungal-specific transcription factor domain-containing protein [Phyllosticta citriasiana]|uniref:fungal-specific transcription factor domain-containing protein n=1 Tax=Phyllosticta citriasiana TaxID=595635 RepID=UPI0030FD66B9